MAKFQKTDAENLEINSLRNNKAQLWQKELTEYMKDENFARYYMVVTEKGNSYHISQLIFQF